MSTVYIWSKPDRVLNMHVVYIYLKEIDAPWITI